MADVLKTLSPLLPRHRILWLSPSYCGGNWGTIWSKLLPELIQPVREGSKVINPLAEFPVCDVNLIKDFVGVHGFLLTEHCPEKWRRNHFSLFNSGSNLERNAKCLGAQSRKGSLKEKQSTAVKSQRATTWPAQHTPTWPAQAMPTRQA